MVKEFVDLWDKGQEELLKKYEWDPPESYESIFEDVARMLGMDDVNCSGRGDYQGTLLCTARGAFGHYYACCVDYGSCSVCDAFEAADDARDYWTLALHMVQGLVEIKRKGDA